ncbi:MAG: BatA domain-containing protein [Myxococcaceae bacterium]
MIFGFPLGLLALGTWIPLAATYFLRRKQQPRRVSALFLWRAPQHRAQSGPRFERFSRELSFLLESLAILTGALYLADLRIGEARERTHEVIVLDLDGSLSMSADAPAEPGEESALDVTKRRAQRRLR